jgi:hypothetical protein
MSNHPAPMVPNVFVTGSSGGGKSFYIRNLVNALKGKYRYLVVLNTSRQLADLCERHEYIGEDDAELFYSPEKIAAVIRAWGSLSIELAADAPKAFLDSLGRAIWKFGKFEADKLEILVVVDECDNFLSKEILQRPWRKIEKEGRKYGVGIIKASQQLASTGADTIHPVVRRQTRFFVVFPLSDDAERKRIMSIYPGMPDPGTLLFPVPQSGLPPEFLVFDRIRGRGVRMTRRGSRLDAVAVGGAASQSGTSRIGRASGAMRERTASA